jgi:Cu(I)/Ag(I) efflux system membrane fusion protein
MKKLFVLLFFAGVILAASCKSGSSDKGQSVTIETTDTLAYYTCPMHPEVHSDQPGDCPICGMKLIKIEATETDSTQSPE